MIHDELKPIRLFLPSILGYQRIALEVIRYVGEMLSVEQEKIENLQRAVHEAFINCVKHGYGCSADYEVQINIRAADSTLEVEVQDFGKGNVAEVFEPPNIPQKVEKGEIHKGWGLFLIHRLVDKVEIQSAPGKGTSVRMKINLNNTYRKSTKGVKK